MDQTDFRVKRKPLIYLTIFQNTTAYLRTRARTRAAGQCARGRRLSTATRPSAARWRVSFSWRRSASSRTEAARRRRPMSAGRILDLHGIARAIDGVVVGGQVLAPSPGHSRHDRSLCVKLSAAARDGFIVHSFSDPDGWKDCREYVAGRLGLASDSWKREPEPTHERPPREPEPDNRAVAIGLWRRRKPVEGTLAETYLRRTRGYSARSPRRSDFCRLAATTRRL